MISTNQKYLVPAILALLVIGYTILVFLSEGTIGGADDMTHYRYSRYAYQNPYFFLHHWGKPFFTAVSSPFAQFGYNGIRIFNVLAGAAAAYFTFRTAKLLKFQYPVVAIFLVISAPLYTMLMLSGMTEILFSLVLILTIFLFYKKQYVWSAILLSFLPFVRTEGMVIFPFFFLAYVWEKQWKAVPFMLLGFVFYSIVGSFHFKDILWVIHEMPYKGNAKDIYGSGELLHYVIASKYIFGIGLKVLMVLGIVVWIMDPFLKQKQERKDWMMQMLVIYLPFIAYFGAHSFVWWKGLGNSVGMIRVIAAIVPSVALLSLLGWSRLMGMIPLKNIWKQLLTTVLCIFLVIIPHRVYDIPVPLGGTQKLVKEASTWLKKSEYFENKIYYYDPFFCHFMGLNPYDEERVRGFVFNSDEPEYNIQEGEIVIWDAHFSANEGRFPLVNIMNNPGFKLVHLVRPVKTFKVLGGYEYEIYIFQRIMEDDGIDNHQIYEVLLDNILNSEK
jgi:hypothetical protein